MRTIRLAARMVGLAAGFLWGAIDYFFQAGWRWRPMDRAKWLRRISRNLLRALGFQIEIRGTPPEDGFVLSNHLGYIDVLVMASIAPQAFLSRQDVRDWFFIGAYTRMAGTLFIDRKRRSEVAEKAAEFARVIDAGVGMTVFLEGTSSDGSQVLPFRSSLLEPVLKNGWKVTPAYLKYECEGGDPARDVCWWGDMEFGGHLVRMAKLKRVRATVIFGEPRIPSGDRKTLAVALREEVVALGRDL